MEGAQRRLASLAGYAHVPSRAVRSVFSQDSLPIFHFYLLLLLAAAISTFGLLTNSAATISELL